jgi:hypothetical protein
LYHFRGCVVAQAVAFKPHARYMNNPTISSGKPTSVKCNTALNSVWTSFVRNGKRWHLSAIAIMQQQRQRDGSSFRPCPDATND